jgi:hypothetical protein
MKSFLIGLVILAIGFGGGLYASKFDCVRSCPCLGKVCGAKECPCPCPPAKGDVAGDCCVPKK